MVDLPQHLVSFDRIWLFVDEGPITDQNKLPKVYPFEVAGEHLVATVSRKDRGVTWKITAPDWSIRLVLEWATVEGVRAGDRRYLVLEGNEESFARTAVFAELACEERFVDSWF